MRVPALTRSALIVAAFVLIPFAAGAGPNAGQPAASATPPSQPGEAAAPAAPAAAPEAGEGERRVLICRTVETFGTRLRSKRMCAEASQWREVNRESERFTKRLQNVRGPLRSPNAGGG